MVSGDMGQEEEWKIFLSSGRKTAFDYLFIFVFKNLFRNHFTTNIVFQILIYFSRTSPVFIHLLCFLGRSCVDNEVGQAWVKVVEDVLNSGALIDINMRSLTHADEFASFPDVSICRSDDRA